MTVADALRRAGDFLRRLYRELGYDDVMGMAAQIAFYLMLSLFPFLLFLLSLVSFLPIPNLQAETMAALAESLPAESYRLVSDIVQSVLSTRRQELLGFGLVASLWSGSMGIGALITTINRAYNVRPRRTMPHQKALAIVLTVVLSVIMLLSSVIVLFGPTVTHGIFQQLGLAGDARNAWTQMRLFVVFGLNLLTLSILYYWGPEARQQFRWILPGAVTSAVLWIGASSLFRLFLRNFGNYELTYGSIAAVIVLMVYFWLLGLIFLLGAEINALMKRMEEHGPDRARA